MSFRILWIYLILEEYNKRFFVLIVLDFDLIGLACSLISVVDEFDVYGLWIIRGKYVKMCKFFYEKLNFLWENLLIILRI